MSMGEGKRDLKREAVDKLFSKQLELSEFMNVEEVSVLVPEDFISKLVEEANYRAEKWKRKRKLDVDEKTLEQIRQRVGSSQLFRIGLDELIQNVLGYSGFSGAEGFNYLIFAYSVGSLLRRSPPPSWKDRVEKQIEVWRIKHGGDDKLLKAVSLATAKWVWKFYHT